MPIDGPSGAPQKAALSQALDGLWQRFLPEITERVAVLEAAAHTLNAEQRQAAQAAAHKLAGVLGTFGLARGTELARELERFFASESLPSVDTDARLDATVAELRDVVENRKPSA